MMNGFVDKKLRGTTRRISLFTMRTHTMELGGAMSCDGSQGSSSAKTMLTEGLEGSVAWEGKGWY